MIVINNFLFLLFVILSIYFIMKKHKDPIKYELFTFDKIPLWTYYDKKKISSQHKIYLDLCIETFKKYNDEDFEIIQVDDISISRYIPDAPKNINELNDDIKINYIKFNLLYHYGGLWIDVNTIVLTNLKIFTDKLIQYDFIGFGCKEPNCENNSYYSKPSLSILGSRKNSILIKNVKDKINKLLQEKNYKEDIQQIFWNNLSTLISDNKYEYYHFNPMYSGQFDNDNNEINMKQLISKDDINFENTNIKIIHIDFKKLELNEKLTREDIFNINNNISTLFRKSLYPEHPYPNLPLILNKDVEVFVLFIPKREVYIRNTIDRLFIDTNYFKGFNKNDLNEEELVKEEYIDKEWTLSPKFNFGRVACHMGHMAILKEFLHNVDKKYALIFEDDIYIDLANVNYVREKIKTILNNIPSDAEVVYLSFCWERCDKSEKYNEIFSHSVRPLCRHMYLVSKKGASIILNNTKHLSKPGDNTISLLIEKKILKSYNVNPEYFHLEQNRQTLGSNLGNDKLYELCRPKKWKK